jgi:quercetin dioxygenase-like cupin family protein
MRLLLCVPLLLLSHSSLSEAIVIPHGSLMAYEKNNNKLTGVATPSHGAVQSEIWHSSIAVGSETPLHTHEAEEIVILLAGRMQAVVGKELSSCDAPCTIILPANESHILKNIGDIPTNHYLVMPIKSKIFDAHSNEMVLPWRR